LAFVKIRCTESHNLLRKVNDLLTIFYSLIFRSERNSAQEICTLIMREFLENQPREGHTSLWAQMKLHLRIYRENM